jgi:iron-sulfur cluster assembly accessory protein
LAESTATAPAAAPVPDRPLTLEEKKAAARARAKAARAAEAAGVAQVAVTDAARDYIRRSAAEAQMDDGVRLRILAGGCSGLEYKIDLIGRGEQPGAGEREIQANGIRLFMDLKSSIHVTGSVIDYESTLLRRGFKIKNPNATTTCSCGESFGV